MRHHYASEPVVVHIQLPQGTFVLGIDRAVCIAIAETEFVFPLRVYFYGKFNAPERLNISEMPAPHLQCRREQPKPPPKFPNAEKE